MSSLISVACGFLSGTILSVEGGYRVLQHPRPERVFDRIADARWFLAVNWCDRCAAPAAILTHDGQLSFQNQAALVVGEAEFLPPAQRASVFRSGCNAQAGEFVRHTIQKAIDRGNQQVQVTSIEVDARYGPVVIVQALGMDVLPERSPF